jgi:hypothetical protein
MDVPDILTSYEYFATFTRSYIQSYMTDPSRERDIRFAPPHDVDGNSNLHCRTQDFAKAQNILFGKLDTRPASVMSYPEFVQLSARRILYSVDDNPEYEDEEEVDETHTTTPSDKERFHEL